MNWTSRHTKKPKYGFFEIFDFLRKIVDGGVLKWKDFPFDAPIKSSDYVSNSASINRLAASTSNSEFVREETTLKEDPENEMNIETNSLKKDRQSPLTKQVDFGKNKVSSIFPCILISGQDGRRAYHFSLLILIWKIGIYSILSHAFRESTEHNRQPDDFWIFFTSLLAKR